MNRRGKRIRLATGVYRDAIGLSAIVQVRRARREKRFRPDTPIRAIRGWQDDTRRRLDALTPEATRGTFAEDVTRYLARVKPLLASYPDRAREIETWLPVFRLRPRWTITTDEIDAQLYAWRQTRAASTVNHRRDALSNLYWILGRRRDHAVTQAVRFKVPAPVARAVPRDRIEKVLTAMIPSRTRARLKVLQWTGMRPSQLQRMQADDLDLERRVCYVPWGKGGENIAVPLTTKGLSAWQEFVARNAWGRWSVSAARIRLYAACRASGVPRFSIVQLRHSYGTELRRRGADLDDVRALLGHRDIRTTRRYAPIVSEKLIAAVERLE